MSRSLAPVNPRDPSFGAEPSAPALIEISLRPYAHETILPVHLLSDLILRRPMMQFLLLGVILAAGDYLSDDRVRLAYDRCSIRVGASISKPGQPLGIRTIVVRMDPHVLSRSTAASIGLGIAVVNCAALGAYAMTFPLNQSI